jgi:hypothetical protein
MKKFFYEHHWLWNATIILIVSGLVFYFDPVGRAYEAADYRKDGGLKWILIIGSIVTMLATVISLRHYWKWIVIATVCVATAQQIHSHFVRYAGQYQDYTPMMHVVGFVGNNLIYLAFTLPPAALVRYIRKSKRK